MSFNKPNRPYIYTDRVFCITEKNQFKSEYVLDKYSMIHALDDKIKQMKNIKSNKYKIKQMKNIKAKQMKSMKSKISILLEAHFKRGFKLH